MASKVLIVRCASPESERTQAQHTPVKPALPAAVASLQMCLLANPVLKLPPAQALQLELELEPGLYLSHVQADCHHLHLSQRLHVD